MNYEQLLIQIGIADVQAAAQFLIAYSKTGPEFKAAAQNAVAALTALAMAAQNPTV